MERKTRPHWIMLWALIFIGVAILGGIVIQRLPFGSLTDYAYWTCVVFLIFLWGQSAATAEYRSLQESPEAEQYKTEEELDSEGRRRASIAFEKGALRGLFIVGIPAFLLWVLVHCALKAILTAVISDQ